MHKEKEKKKLALVDKLLPINEMLTLLKLGLKQFPRHRFNVEHTKSVTECVMSNLCDSTDIFKYQDFSENYTCLLPNEIQSLHWQQTSDTVFPVVVVMNCAGEIHEDHLVFISDDLQHDYIYVELMNKKSMNIMLLKDITLS